MAATGPGQTEKQERQGNHMAIYTDIAPEIYPPGRGRVPEGVRCTVHQAGACRITRVRIERDGLARPAGSYVTVETPRVAVLDDQDEKLTALLAREVAEMLPPGPVLVVGVGNRRVTADALGPRVAGQVLVTRGLETVAAPLGLRTVASIAPGPGGVTGLALAGIVAALVKEMDAAAVLAVDSLACAGPERLGRSVQLADAGLRPAGDTARSLTRDTVGVPVVALGIPTMMDAGAVCSVPGLVVTPRDLDGLVRRGSHLLARAVNRALQPRLTPAELGRLVS